MHMWAFDYPQTYAVTGSAEEQVAQLRTYIWQLVDALNQMDGGGEEAAGGGEASALRADIGAMSGGDYYTKAETDAAIAVRASTSAYGTTKLSNSTTSSSKTLAATPYAVKTALAQAKAYVDSAIAVAINSAY